MNELHLFSWAGCSLVPVFTKILLIIRRKLGSLNLSDITEWKKQSRNFSNSTWNSPVLLRNKTNNFQNDFSLNDKIQCYHSLSPIIILQITTSIKQINFIAYKFHKGTYFCVGQENEWFQIRGRGGLRSHAIWSSPSFVPM